MEINDKQGATCKRCGKDTAHKTGESRYGFKNPQPVHHWQCKYCGAKYDTGLNT